MPELPEVEITRRRLEPLLTGKRFGRIVTRTEKLREPIPQELRDVLPGKRLVSLTRRGKYLLFHCEGGCLVIHLGMTGFLLMLPALVPPHEHDRLDLIFTDGQVLRFRDPRKFGMVFWTGANPFEHPLLAAIGPEPLEDAFSGAYLFSRSRSRKIAVKQFIMDGGIVAGIGNIYANEALFQARIRPDRAAGSLGRRECRRLVEAIRMVLEESLALGSTYQGAPDVVAYHPLAYSVYGRGGAPCCSCGQLLAETRLGNRSTVFCPSCQR